MIGNGLLSRQLNIESLIDYAYYHGLISPTKYAQILRLCHDGNYYDYGDRSASAEECFTVVRTYYIYHFNCKAELVVKYAEITYTL